MDLTNQGHITEDLNGFDQDIFDAAGQFTEHIAGWDLSTRHAYEHQDIKYDELISDMPEINVTDYIRHAS